jgi:hypothetical protein
MLSATIFLRHFISIYGRSGGEIILLDAAREIVSLGEAAAQSPPSTPGHPLPDLKTGAWTPQPVYSKSDGGSFEVDYGVQVGNKVYMVRFQNKTTPYLDVLGTLPLPDSSADVKNGAWTPDPVYSKSDGGSFEVDYGVQVGNKVYMVRFQNKTTPYLDVLGTLPLPE